MEAIRDAPLAICEPHVSEWGGGQQPFPDFFIAPVEFDTYQPLIEQFGDMALIESGLLVPGETLEPSQISSPRKVYLLLPVTRPSRRVYLRSSCGAMVHCSSCRALTGKLGTKPASFEKLADVMPTIADMTKLGKTIAQLEKLIVPYRDQQKECLGAKQGEVVHVQSLKSRRAKSEESKI